MDANLIHDIIFYVMYAALAIAVVILVERGLYFSWAQRQALRFEKALTPDVRRASDLPESLTGRSSLPLTLILPVLEKKQTAAGLLVQKLTLGQKEKEVLVQKARQEADSLKDAAFDTMRRMVDLRNRIRTLETEQEQRMRRREALKKEHRRNRKRTCKTGRSLPQIAGKPG